MISNDEQKKHEISLASSEQTIQQAYAFLNAFLNDPPADLLWSYQGMALRAACLGILSKPISDQEKVSEIKALITDTVPALSLSETLRTWFAGLYAFCAAILRGQFRQSFTFCNEAVVEQRTQYHCFYATMFKKIDRPLKNMLVIGAEKSNPLDCARFDAYCRENHVEWFGHKNEFHHSSPQHSVHDTHFRDGGISEEAFAAKKSSIETEILERAKADFLAYLDNELPNQQQVDILMVDRSVINFFCLNLHNVFPYHENPKVNKFFWELRAEIEKKILFLFASACMTRLRDTGVLIIASEQPEEIAPFFQSTEPLTDTFLVDEYPATFLGIQKFSGFKKAPFNQQANPIEAQSVSDYMRVPT
ncbi:MAG: hypothetical protein KBB94_01550 [Legionellaceae bacterium]|nr:hypothetical protein [Legionellaceae bacterium]MBP9774610.1 hypothetical protein [Legionellaceae bacterium]